MLVGSGFDADLMFIEAQGISDMSLHPWHVRHDFGRLSHDRGVDVDELAARKFDLSRRLLQKYAARRSAPARVRVRKECPNVSFAESAEHCIANSVHEHVGIRMSIQAFGVRNLYPAE